MKLAVFAVGAALLVAACSTAPADPATTSPTVGAPAPEAPVLRLELITDALDEPVALATRTGDDRVYVAEKRGRIRLIDDDVIVAEPFLDIQDLVLSEASEQGLLGLTFDGDGERLFVTYTDNTGALLVDEYPVQGDRVDTDSATTLFTIDQPYAAHQGGAIQFGPDGYLWIGLGDGGGIGDPSGNAQNTGTLLGSVVRVDVDGSDGYAIPPGNAFAGPEDGAQEIWAFGLRNPWRITFDSGFIYIADVGQDWWEEVNILPIDASGANLGWPILEGNACYEAESCDITGLVPPAFTAKHQRSCALIGGPVYRGRAIPGLTGHYFYGDYCVGWVRSLVFDGSQVIAERDWEADLGTAGNITTFGVDAAGEILLANLEGELYRIMPAG